MACLMHVTLSIFMRRMKSSPEKAGAQLGKWSHGWRISYWVRNIVMFYTFSRNQEHWIDTNIKWCLIVRVEIKEHYIPKKHIYNKYKYKITGDNSEGCVQVVCHKIWDIYLYSNGIKQKNVTFDPALPYFLRDIYMSLISNDRWPNILATKIGLCIPKSEHPQQRLKLIACSNSPKETETYVQNVFLSLYSINITTSWL